MSFESFDLTGLSNLLHQSDPAFRDRDDSDDDEPNPGKLPIHKSGPGDISTKTKAGALKDKKAKTSEEAKSAIWSSDEVSKEATKAKTNIPIQNDPRATPKYEMYYRQAVTSEDVFLQMGNKTPGSASCENLVVEVHLPGEEDFNKIQLNLKEQAIDLRSSIHFLYLGLPHRIDTKAGHAKWDQDKEKLIVTLKLSRELDGINF